MTYNRYVSRRMIASLLFVTTTALTSLSSRQAVAQIVQPQQKMSFHIPAGSLSDALVSFSTQSHVLITSTAVSLRGHGTSGLSGQFTPTDALRQLLQGSGLSYSSAGNRAFQIVPAPKAANITLGPVRVGGTVAHENPTGPGVGYVTTNTMSATKTDTPITEIPNSVYVLTKQAIVDQQPQTIEEALRYMPGVYTGNGGMASNGAAYGTSGDIMQRGFASSQFVDGLLSNSKSAGETQFVERIEAINGPASVMYGQVTPGGMIGISLKKPTDTPLHQVSLGFGNWGRYEATFDVSDKITKSGNVRYRIAGIGVTQGTQVNHVDYKRVGVLPSITWDIDKKTSLTLMGMYMYTPGQGIASNVPVHGSLLTKGYDRISRSTFDGLTNFNNLTTKDAMFEYQFNHKFSKYINFSQVFRYEDSYSSQKTSYYDGMAGDNEWYLTPWWPIVHNKTESLDTKIFGSFSTGPVEHKWVVGSDFRILNYSYENRTNNDTVINVYNPFSSYNPCFSSGCTYVHGLNEQNYFQEGVYFQDQIKWKGLSVLLGGRQDWVNYKNTQKDIIAGATTRSTPQPDSKFTWRAGLIYKFDFGLSPYFSYSTSFVPQAGSMNYQGQAFAPLTGKQIEAGVKYKIPGRDILLTASAFHINEDHYLITDLVHGGSEDAGRVRSQGFEASATANITRNLRLIGSYSFTDIRLENTNTTLRAYNPYTLSRYGNAISEKGKYVPHVPRNMFSIFADYIFPSSLAKGFGINGGIRYTGFTYSDAVNSYKIPEYILFDIGAHYDLGSVSTSLRGLRAQLSVSNLTNKYYVTSCTTATCSLGQGRRVYGNLTYNW